MPPLFPSPPSSVCPYAIASEVMACPVPIHLDLLSERVNPRDRVICAMPCVSLRVLSTNQMHKQTYQGWKLARLESIDALRINARPTLRRLIKSTYNEMKSGVASHIMRYESEFLPRVRWESENEYCVEPFNHRLN